MNYHCNTRRTAFKSLKVLPISGIEPGSQNCVPVTLSITLRGIPDDGWKFHNSYLLGSLVFVFQQGLSFVTETFFFVLNLATNAGSA